MASNVNKPPILDETGQEIKSKLSQILTRLPNLKGDKFLSLTPFIYSENEEQVGIWVDGKPIYQKTINVASGSLSSGELSISNGLSNISEVVDWECEFTRDTTNPQKYTLPMNRTIANEGIGLTCRVNTDGTVTTNIVVNNGATTYSSISNIRLTLKYTKTADSAWQGGFKAYGFTPVIYSDTEREIGVWRNGKPLYQRTFSISGGIACAYNTWVNTNIPTPANIEKVITSIASANSAVDNPVLVSCDNPTIYIMNVRNTSVTIVDFTIQYTKTTDTAGSGKYTTLGTPTVHYSTDEQVIGTWVDGSTLYQKTFSGLSLSVPSMSWVDTGKVITNGNKW